VNHVKFVFLVEQSQSKAAMDSNGKIICQIVRFVGPVNFVLLVKNISKKKNLF